MNHNPFEEWLFEDQLTSEERTQLNVHLKECASCRALSAAGLETSRLLSNSAPVSPAAGFTDRWASFATAKEAAEQKKQVRLLFILLASFALLSVTSLFLSSYFSDHFIMAVLSNVIFKALHLIERTIIIIQSYRFVLTVLPFRIPYLMWVVVMANAAFWMAFWSLSIWKFSSLKRVFA